MHHNVYLNTHISATVPTGTRRRVVRGAAGLLLTPPPPEGRNVTLVTFLKQGRIDSIPEK